MNTTHEDYNHFNYIERNKNEKEEDLIKAIKELILNKIETYESYNEDGDDERLLELKSIDLDSIGAYGATDFRDEYDIMKMFDEFCELEKEVETLKTRIDCVNDILKILPETNSIIYSRKSESTYLSYPIEMLNDFVDNHANLIKSNYYEDLAVEKLKELVTFEVRIACHEVGSRFNEYSNESVSYSNECIYIKA